MAKELSLCWPEHSWSCVIGYVDENPKINGKNYVKGSTGKRQRNALCDKLKYNQDCSPNNAKSECEGLGTASTTIQYYYHVLGLQGLGNP